MARKTRSTELETRTARAKLTVGRYHWRGIRQGLAIGYRKVKGGKGGTWTVRLMVGPNKYVTERLGIADDHQDANGIDMLSYDQAQEKARDFASDYAKRRVRGPQTETKPYTVRHAINDHLRWYAVNRKALKNTRIVCEAHVLPELGERPLKELTPAELRDWHQTLAAAPARLRGQNRRRPLDPSDSEAVRRRKASANRVLTVLKAALNQAYQDGRAPSDEAWRKTKPFGHVGAPRIRYLLEDECRRLLNACPADFRALVRGALLTGARFGELVKMRVNEYDAQAGTVLAREPKNGRPRHIPLSGDGCDFFDRLTVGRDGQGPRLRT
ncbi:MAG: tyrosine-type recombinase/integrase [Gammaproteobacteria bacterium]|nr:tyrosine-type recombinase/integrase [Gammaproteobacteria bacterium]NIR84567.1 tyrosine-type recombinase/integrase [Gammaproteobacteria bacterium]NIR90470.1 tyrosine-type recombinase/integrase [Gammaproteobacteria bacterium]NIU05618.1 tyrosine-type recombinase/integrase [Gammaproteobacteria bacterium]NIV52757.1 tyrosine-type recombinase/integrase [Gammaproteobacteria bacterium]